MTRHPLDAAVAALDPVPDAEAAVDPATRDAHLRAILSTAAGAPARRPRWRVRALVLGATVVAATVALSIGLLAGRETARTPPSLGVAAALADELRRPDRILHTRERITRADGTRSVEEGWTLLGDARYSHYRIVLGEHVEEGAMSPRTTTGYDSRTDTLTTVLQARTRPDPGPWRVPELSAERMARRVADGTLPVRKVVLAGRPAYRLRDADGVWYLAQDAPVILRRELDRPRTVSDFEVWEVVPATAANRAAMLQVRAPAGSRRKTIHARPPRAPVPGQPVAPSGG